MKYWKRKRKKDTAHEASNTHAYFYLLILQILYFLLILWFKCEMALHKVELLPAKSSQRTLLFCLCFALCGNGNILATDGETISQFIDPFVNLLLVDICDRNDLIIIWDTNPSNSQVIRTLSYAQHRHSAKINSRSLHPWIIDLCVWNQIKHFPSHSHCFAFFSLPSDTI